MWLFICFLLSLIFVGLTYGFVHIYWYGIMSRLDACNSAWGHGLVVFSMCVLGPLRVVEIIVFQLLS